MKFLKTLILLVLSTNLVLWLRKRTFVTKGKALFPIALFLLISIPLKAQKDINYNPESLYPFEDYYINLDNLERVEVNGTLSSNFKTSSKYASRFIKASYDKVKFRGKEFVILPENGLKIVDLRTGMEKILENKEKDIEKDINGRSFVFSTNNSVVYIKKLDGEHGYMIYKYDEDGNEIFSVQIEHTDIVKKGNVRHHYPYLYYFMHTNDFLIFTSYDSRYEKTCVINLENGDTDFFEFIAAGVIRGEDENSINGYVIIPDNTETLEVKYLDNSWQANLKHIANSNKVQTILKDSILVVADYHQIATGSNLSAFNIYTGELLWQADVKQMNVGHSEYYNEVILSMYSDKVIMEGIESYAHYLQIFDIETGERLFVSDILK